MNKLLTTILLVLICSLSLQAQTNTSTCAPGKESDWKRDDLLGRVKNIHTYKAWFRKDEKTGRMIEGESDLEEEASYDARGSQIEWKNRNYLPADPKDALTSTYICDATNRIVEIKFVRLDGSLVKRITYGYDDRGNKIEQADYFPDGTLERKEKYTLDSRGNMIEEVSTEQVHPEHFNPKRYDVYVTTKRTFKYDDRNNTTEEKHFYPDGSLYGTWINGYDSNGRLVKVVRTDKQNRLEDLNIYTYGSGRRLVEESHYSDFCYNRDGSMCEGSLNTDVGVFGYGTKTIYEYDARGNWIKQIEYASTSKKVKSYTSRVQQRSER